MHWDSRTAGKSSAPSKTSATWLMRPIKSVVCNASTCCHAFRNTTPRPFSNLSQSADMSNWKKFEWEEVQKKSKYCSPPDRFHFAYIVFDIAWTLSYFWVTNLTSHPPKDNAELVLPFPTMLRPLWGKGVLIPYQIYLQFFRTPQPFQPIEEKVLWNFPEHEYASSNLWLILLPKIPNHPILPLQNTWLIWPTLWNHKTVNEVGIL